MSQPQPQMPQRAFSPPQPSPSPAAAQPGFALPPNKRPRLSPGATPQPESPYSTSPYAASPGAPVTPSTAATSAGSPIYPSTQQQQQSQLQQPQMQQPQQPQQAANTYATPYTNGNTTSGLALPESRPTPPPQLSAPQLPTPPTLPYTNATLALGNPNTPGTPIMQQPSPTPGVMGPPSRPADRPQKEYEYDVTDSLAGTGIDLRAEEQYLSELYVPDGQRTGFPAYPPGGKGSFYGAGPANQPAQPAGVDTQSQLAAQQAEKAWQESAKRLAQTRTMELVNAFLQVPVVFRKAEKFAKEQGLSLNLELRNNQPMGRMRLPEEFPHPTVNVSTKMSPDSTMVTTTGTWIPHEAYLVDQLALLSLATKQRMRTLIEDANRISKTRQASSHGEVPEEWQIAAAPLKSAMDTQEGGAQQTGTEDGASPRPPKRPLEDANSSQPSKVQKISTTNTMSHTVREVGKAERDWEERRLRRRNARKDGTAEPGSTPSRAGSVAPGTPGGSAPDSEKAISKKEQKKLDAVKKAEASSHANQNITSSMFVGMPKTGSLFGKKKGGKSYSWMTGGTSGASTPRLGTPGKPGAGASSGPAPPTNHALTVEGRARLGNWREDKEKGKNIQLRDWVFALEGDEIEVRAMQAAYNKMDTSDPK
ncbi:TPS-inducible protein [Colletotrichum plurivorum]|uniref:Transcription initiation factor TFIID subunit 4 n=1 Tax=Colletotrichum plurivorum TaxID=2175906 RepID=A0A8H6N6L8_9PEZI|nr:TPS-inducible protein [Colletotrichum plurivorum]